MVAFLWWMVIGLVAGALARLVVPGRQSMGLALTLALGLAGSLLGGFVSPMVFGYDPWAPGFHAGGVIMSTIGAVVVLGGYVLIFQRKGVHL